MSVNYAWTEERIDELKKLWADGLSASRIAGELGGTTRNAVISKVHRLGMADRDKCSRRAVGTAAMAVVKRIVRARKARVEQPTLVPEPQPVTDIVENIIPVGQRKTLMELTHGDCRWPIGDPGSSDLFFCAAHVEAGSSYFGSYCAYHSRIAYEPVRPSKRVWMPRRDAA